tara:strand:- start:175 stop:456 length:282 start_codon:yes stop_codon:yes gene_type:complete
MERLYTVWHVAAKTVGARTRSTLKQAREADLDRMSWRLRKGKSLIKEGVPRKEWLDQYSRKVTGTPISEWSPEELDTIRRFIESVEAHGTNGW